MPLEDMIEQIKIWSAGDRVFKEGDQIISALRRLEKLEAVGRAMRVTFDILEQETGPYADVNSRGLARTGKAWDAACKGNEE